MEFVVAPFLPRFQPALGVSTLAAILRGAGIPSRVRYVNLDLVDSIGPAVYDVVAHWTNLAQLGEMVFTGALWGVHPEAWNAYVDALMEDHHRVRDRMARTTYLPDGVSRRAFEDLVRGRLGTLYAEAPAMLEQQAAEIVAGGARIVGFSTTFQQNVASLALARAIRALAPPESISIVFGGANCEGEMGRAIADNFPFVDHIVSGEADRIIVPLVKEIRGWQEGRSARPPRYLTGLPVEDMDSLPIPDFDDYVSTREKSKTGGPWQLVCETARGCWWGASSHCRFCGLNATTMSFRSKSPVRAASEFQALRSRYQQRRLMMADNILDWRYLSTLLPEIAGKGFQLFYEVKSNLRRDQVKIMREAGIDWIQPGIESLSTAMLTRMGKGATGSQQVQLLKACCEQQMKVSWNLLYGFPGDQSEEYSAITRLGEKLFHLPPPAAVVPIRLDRFSPYFEHSHRQGIRDVRAAWSYAHVYPSLSEAERHRIAYFFEFDYAIDKRPPADVTSLLDIARRWAEAWARGARLTRIGGLVFDSRYGEEIVTKMTNSDVEMLLRLENATRWDQIEAGDLETVRTLLERGWVVEIDGQLLSVVTRFDRAK